MVEFAVVVPLFILLLFGVMEAGWLFSQQIEVRNAAREGARLAAVDFGASSEIIAETCSRASLSEDRASVYLSQVNPGGDDASALVTVSQNYQPLTGLLPMFNNIRISADVEMRIERDEVNWTAVSGSAPGLDPGACP